MFAVAPSPPARPPLRAAPRPWRWSPAAYRRLGQIGLFAGRRVELIRGEIIEMSPAGWPHTLATTLTAEALRRAFAGIGWVIIQGPLPTPDSEPEPDVRVVPGDPRSYADHPRQALLVVEVADSSLFYDITTKAELYACAGIPDYWVLDLAGRRLLVYRGPTALPAGGHAYAACTAHGPAEAVAPLAAPHHPIRVADLLP